MSNHLQLEKTDEIALRASLGARWRSEERWMSERALFAKSDDSTSFPGRREQRQKGKPTG